MIIQMALMITEIMFDPDPPAFLPAFEFVEWHNPGKDTVDLRGWKWLTGSGCGSPRLIGGGSVAPGGYLIVCSRTAAPFFEPFGDVLALESFPALKNTGDRLTLLDPLDHPVHSVRYSPDSNGDVIRQNGGWSLELADFSQPCSDEAWWFSLDPSGGTPGRQNSLLMAFPEPGPAVLLRAALYGEDGFLLLYSGPLSPENRKRDYSCRFEPDGITARSVVTCEYGFPGLFFSLPEGLMEGVTYSVELSGDEVLDCLERPAASPAVPFGLPIPAGRAGVVISEILFDPGPDQVEFIELFNRSGHTVDLAGIVVARAEPGGAVISWSDEQDLSCLLFPGQYAVLTQKSASVLKAWPGTDPARMVNRPDLPVLPNSENRILLFDRMMDTIDQAAYSPDWHYPYLGQTKGVSLERVDMAFSGLLRENWSSASGDSGYATPGEPNSNQAVRPSEGEEYFRLPVTVGFAGGHSDPAAITLFYSFPENGWFAGLNVYDRAGKPVRSLLPFTLMGREGSVRWDGLDDAGRQVPEGIYILVSEYRHPAGRMGRWKGACSLVRDY